MYHLAIVSRLRLAAALALVVASAGVAAAQSRRVGVVARAAADPPVSADAVAEAVAGVAGADDVAVVEPGPIPGAVRRSRLQSFRRAAELSDQGWRAYRRVEAAFAEARLAAARTTAEEVLDLPGGTELVADISIRLGAVRLYRGRPSEADDDFRLAATLWPEREVTVAEFRPEVVEAYRVAVAATRAAAMLEVRAPAGASVVVDGRRAGTGTARIEVEVGHHAVVVRSPGAAPGNAIVIVPPAGASVQVEPEPDELIAARDAPLSIGGSEQAAQLAVEARAIYGELDAVLLVAPVWRRGAPALLGQLCADEPLQCTAVREVAFDRPVNLARAAAALWTGLWSEARRFPPTLLVDVRLTRGERRPGTSGTGRARRSAWYKNQWLWIGVGTAAVAATAYFVLSGDASTDTIIGFDPCDFGGDC